MKLKTRGAAECFRLNYTQPASLLNGLNIVLPDLLIFSKSLTFSINFLPKVIRAKNSVAFYQF